MFCQLPFALLSRQGGVTNFCWRSFHFGRAFQDETPRIARFDQRFVWRCIFICSGTAGGDRVRWSEHFLLRCCESSAIAWASVTICCDEQSLSCADHYGADVTALVSGRVWFNRRNPARLSANVRRALSAATGELNPSGVSRPAELSLEFQSCQWRSWVLLR